MPVRSRLLWSRQPLTKWVGCARQRLFDSDWEGDNDKALCGSNPLGEVNKGVKERGFTLIEMVFVITILGVVSVLGGSFVVWTLEAYREGQERSLLALQSRAVIEIFTRDLRRAAPNSIRISDSGRCLEFLPVVSALAYSGSLRGAVSPETLSTLTWLPPHAGAPRLRSNEPRHLLVAPLGANEIYSNAQTSARIRLKPMAADLGRVEPEEHDRGFLRDAKAGRAYVAGQPIRYCLREQSLLRHSHYGLSPDDLTDTDPGGRADLVVEFIAPGNPMFALDAGTSANAPAVLFDFSLTRGTKRIHFNHKVTPRHAP